MKGGFVLIAFFALSAIAYIGVGIFGVLPGLITASEADVVSGVVIGADREVRERTGTQHTARLQALVAFMYQGQVYNTKSIFYDESAVPTETLAANTIQSLWVSPEALDPSEWTLIGREIPEIERVELGQEGARDAVYTVKVYVPKGKPEAAFLTASPSTFQIYILLFSGMIASFGFSLMALSRNAPLIFRLMPAVVFSAVPLGWALFWPHNHMLVSLSPIGQTFIISVFVGSILLQFYLAIKRRARPDNSSST